MKINRDISSINSQMIQNYYHNQASKTTKKGAPQQSNVNLSDTAQRLVNNAKNRDIDAGVDAAKVDKIKQQLANGTYKVSPEKIADQMFQEMKQEGNKDE
ncbi:flagellar biosynthesis anti-sigma factor FlgM [Latilactobacillus curvatus]|uniref:flagellar biosynthesis anti-sigma factor FlgM n=1 Tax=Latilactobacillus curvatus TaxID=28038 RepID=UPI00217F0CA2|nr:flagellar biosynthesis anti-sigma factor FlgM [Latilactobacillus curvatus]MCS6142208.1 flagellar biosynthesis anti-sigma factor FlgM [Latilactobacillus curvatus]MCS8617927.1 flagellar biosynthesis anti-sigma factor FlgM [Latilactobacillus curvatus]